jgi:phage portal protein BeeE
MGSTVTFTPKDFILIKRDSLTSKYYGDPIFIDCIESVLILYYIEQVYRKLFENGFIEPTILVDEDSVLTQPQKDAITTFIKDYFRGINNGFEAGIISGKIKKLEITSKVDHNSFIALKKEVKEDIAIALNIPADILFGKNSNRATRESAYEDFNNTVVSPIQSRYVKQLKRGLEPYRNLF